MFLGVYPTVVNWSSDGRECILSLEDNPLIEWVDLSQDSYSNNPLYYCQLYCGMICGALEMVQIQVKCAVCQDPLLDSSTEKTDKSTPAKSTHFKISLIKFLGEIAPSEDDVNL